MENGTAAVVRTTPDVRKVFAAIADIIGRREGRRVRLVGVQQVQDAGVQKKAG